MPRSFEPAQRLSDHAAPVVPSPDPTPLAGISSALGNETMARSPQSPPRFRASLRPTLARLTNHALNQPAPTAGGAVLSLKDLNVIRFIHNELKPDEIKALKKQSLDEGSAGAAGVAAGKGFGPLSDADRLTVLATFKSQLDLTPMDSWAAYSATWNAAPAGAAKEFATELNAVLSNTFVTQVRKKYKRLDTEIEQREKNATKMQALPPNKKAEWSDALRSMPGFGALVREIKKDKKVGAPVVPSEGPQWKDGGNLTDNIVEVDGPNNGPQVAENELRDGTFKKKVKETDDFYKRLLEPDVMKRIPKPRIVVHKLMSLDKAAQLQAAGQAVPNGFGAYQNGGEVHCGQDTFREILVHEVGHHVENTLPREKWQDIQLVVRGRHQQAGGGGMDPNYQGSARMKGDYPATGPYTSVTYNDSVGGMEFTAMTTQFLSDPTTIDTMLDSDPQQVAVLIRGLRPREYSAHAALRAFDPYLPS